MKRQRAVTNLAGTICVAAMSMYLFVPPWAEAQSPPQGPPPATPNARTIPYTTINDVLMNLINLELATKNAELAKDPNFHAVLSAVPDPYGPEMSQTTNTDSPNQFVATAGYTMAYSARDISVRVGNTWVPTNDQYAMIVHDVTVKATCEGWFTGSGTLTYTTTADQASYIGLTNFPNPQTANFLQTVLPNFINNVLTPKIESYPAGSNELDNGARCRTLGTYPTVIIFSKLAKAGAAPPAGSTTPTTPDQSFNYDPAPPVIVGAGQKVVTVKVTKIRRLALQGPNGNPEYSPIETPALEFYAGFSHAHIQLPQMIDGQTFVPTEDNVLTTFVPIETGNLVLIGTMTYEGLPMEDSSFVSYGQNVNFGAGVRTFDVSKRWLQRIVLGKPLYGSGPGYEITVEIVPPPVVIGSK